MYVCAGGEVERRKSATFAAPATTTWQQQVLQHDLQPSQYPAVIVSLVLILYYTHTPHHIGCQPTIKLLILAIKVLIAERK